MHHCFFKPHEKTTKYLSSSFHSTIVFNVLPKFECINSFIGKKGAKPKEYATADEMSQVINVSKYEALLKTVVDDMKESYVKHLLVRTDSGAMIFQVLVFVVTRWL